MGSNLCAACPTCNGTTPPRRPPNFQKMIDHPFTVEDFVTGELAHPQLARADARNRENRSSAYGISKYQTFLAPWKGADLEVPILQQAKAEYANLN